MNWTVIFSVRINRMMKKSAKKCYKHKYLTTKLFIKYHFNLKTHKYPNDNVSKNKTFKNLKIYIKFKHFFKQTKLFNKKTCQVINNKTSQDKHLSKYISANNNTF